MRAQREAHVEHPTSRQPVAHPTSRQPVAPLVELVTNLQRRLPLAVQLMRRKRSRQLAEVPAEPATSKKDPPALKGRRTLK